MKELIVGLYRAYDPKDGASFVGFSRNVEGTLKRLRFELTLNACSYRPLQSFWNERGGLTLEMLEPYDPGDMSDLELEAHLRAKLFIWKAKLGENTRLIQSEVTF